MVHVPVGEGGPGGGGGRGRGEGHHLLDGQPQLEPVQRVADPDLALDLGVGERGHDGARLDIGPARRHIPGHTGAMLDHYSFLNGIIILISPSRHPDPELQPGHDGRPVPQSEWCPSLHRFLEKLVSVSETEIGRNG